MLAIVFVIIVESMVNKTDLILYYIVFLDEYYYIIILDEYNSIIYPLINLKFDDQISL